MVNVKREVLCPLAPPEKDLYILIHNVCSLVTYGSFVAGTTIFVGQLSTDYSFHNNNCHAVQSPPFVLFNSYFPLNEGYFLIIQQIFFQPYC